MNLRAAGFLADENIHSDVIAHLRSHGFDIIRAAAGTPDVDIIRRGVAEMRVVLTHDRDFGTLAIAAGEPVHGIFYLRPGHIEPRFVIETLGAVLDRGIAVEPPFIVVAERRKRTVVIRVRHW